MVFEKLKKIISEATPEEIKEAAIIGAAAIAVFIAKAILFPTKPDPANGR